MKYEIYKDEQNRNAIDLETLLDTDYFFKGCYEELQVMYYDCNCKGLTCQIEIDRVDSALKVKFYHGFRSVYLSTYYIPENVVQGTLDMYDDLVSFIKGFKFATCCI